MSFTSGSGFSTAELPVMAEAAQAAYGGEPRPQGWTVVTPSALDLDPVYQDGDYFRGDIEWSSASAIVLQQGNDFIVSFRGTDDFSDWTNFDELLQNSYVEAFRPLLEALRPLAESLSGPVPTFAFTGHSLGGGAVNQLADQAATLLDGYYAGSRFITFASPIAAAATNVFNIGFENDVVFESGSTGASMTDHLFNYDEPFGDPFPLPPWYAHDVVEYVEAMQRIGASAFSGQMTSDSWIAFDFTDAVFDAGDVPSGGSVLYVLGSQVADTIQGGDGIYVVEGFSGADLLSGGPNGDTILGGLGSDTLHGLDGNDLLDGGPGADTLIGGTGSNIYVVDSAGDRVFESLDADIDRVIASLNFALQAGAAIEVLKTDNPLGTAAQNLTGDDSANHIQGNDGDNTLNGGSGADFLEGRSGSDTYIVANSGDLVFERAGTGVDRVLALISYVLSAGTQVEVLKTIDAAATTPINLTGNERANNVQGNAGNNVVNGGGGNDFLQGLAGKDFFFFNTALNALGNVDVVADYNVAADGIVLEDAIFVGLGAGPLAAESFVIGAAAADATDRIIYNNTTGALLFDADGVGGGAAVRFATLAVGLAMTNAEFQVI